MIIFIELMSKLGEENSMITASEESTLKKWTSKYRKVSKNENNIDVEECVMNWFQSRGIKKGNPEDIINDYKSSIKQQLGTKIRKMSAPTECSLLLQRRSKITINISS